MNYITLGKRKDRALVFLHGWGGAISSFLGAARELVAFGYYAVLLDFPGHGESRDPERPYSVEDYASEVVGLIEELKVKEVIIIAHSFGGRVAVKIAGEMKPNKIKILKIVLIGSAGLKPKRGLYYKLKVRKYKKLKKAVSEGKKDESVLSRYGSEDYKRLSGVMQGSFVKVVNEDLESAARAISEPVLLIWGRKDTETPLYMGKKFSKLIANSRLLVYNTGHYCYIEERERFLEDVFGFLVMK